MKKNDLKKTQQSTQAELDKKISELRSQMYKPEAGQVKNTRFMRGLRKQIAQLLTISRQKSLEKASAK